MPRFRIQKPAEADIDTAFAWYESQREGLGLEFLTAVEATLALIQRSPDQFPRVHRNVRRALVRKFPYAVFYLSTPQRVSVIACVHARRHPRRWQSRR
jgi:toxin ParE1/3/4